ncbi:Tetraspanin family-domain-containing protein [Hygrophoropsis aurantiaca]|uniref:Tetraspanin family-domain-containing protein n=1 Tax=Hygrophoropsis aurantiaca TaxID=72124 RepID=A0ACB8A1T9_9AGAM|nr:Tetraspanin family-domain-containing protein [Hygrophoropsis aurantiaca]
MIEKSWSSRSSEYPSHPSAVGVRIGKDRQWRPRKNSTLKPQENAKWTKHKWCLFISAALALCYGMMILVYSTNIWRKTTPHALLLTTTNPSALTLMLLSGLVLTLTALLGLISTHLSSRPLLTLYALFLWPALLALLSVAYTAYRHTTFALPARVEHSWRTYYTQSGRSVVQDVLGCCGYLTPRDMAEPSTVCPGISGVPLPGCKGKLLDMQREWLGALWVAAFGVAGIHIIVVITALLCANHVTSRFGQGVMPRGYWDDGKLGTKGAEKDGEKRGVARPGMVRTKEGGTFREDRK